MKNKKTLVFFFSSIVIFITLTGLLYSIHLLNNTNKKQRYGIEERLLQFKLIIEKELEKYNLSDKTTTLLGIMYQVKVQILCSLLNHLN